MGASSQPLVPPTLKRPLYAVGQPDLPDDDVLFNFIRAGTKAIAEDFHEGWLPQIAHFVFA